MSEEQKKLLEKQLWAVANLLRGKMNADEYKNYILGFIFYKYLSEKLERYINDKLLNQENYLFTERLKRNTYLQQDTNYYFWRTYDQQEIDLLEEDNKKISAFEFKYSTKKHPKAPIAFANAYPKAKFKVINPNNYLDYIL